MGLALSLGPASAVVRGAVKDWETGPVAESADPATEWDLAGDEGELTPLFDRPDSTQGLPRVVPSHWIAVEVECRRLVLQNVGASNSPFGYVSPPAAMPAHS